MRWIRRTFPTFIRLYRWWNVRFTPGGKAISLLAIYSIPAIISFADVMPFIGLCSLAVLFLTWGLAKMFRPTLDAVVRTPGFGIVGQPFSAAVTVTNPTQQPALDLLVRFPETDLGWSIRQDPEPFSLDVNESVVRRFSLTANQRGLARPPAGTVLTTFPVNLIRNFVRTAESTEIAILPKALPLAINAENGIAQILGIEQRFLATAGQGYEYIGSREYREGPVRRWDYSSWARLGQPIVREFAEEANRQVAILVDTRIARGRRSKVEAAFERYISGAFSVVEHMLNADIEIGHCVVGNEQTSDFARSGNFGHTRIRRLFALTKRTRMKDDPSPTEGLKLHTDGPILLFVPEWDEAREELVYELGLTNPCVRPIMFCDDENETPEGVLALKLEKRGVTIQ